MVFISLLVIGAASASDEAGNLMEMSEMENVQTIETDLNQDTDDLLTNDYEGVLSAEDTDAVESVEEEALSVENPEASGDSIVDPLADNENEKPVLAESEQSQIDVYVDGQFVNSFNFTRGENGYSFAEIMEMLKLSEVDMSTFGNFAEMFSMFNNFTFTDQSEKTFDFKIDGEVGAIKYDLAIISNATDFNFDYSIVSPSQNNPAVTGKVISVYVDGEFLKNLTFTTQGSSQFNFADMINMVNMSNLNISQYMNMFNGTGSSSSAEPKNFDFNIAGEVGAVKYNLIMIQNETGFTFDYKILYPVVEVVLDAKDITITAVDAKIDGKIGKNITVTLKDALGKVLSNANGVAKLFIYSSKAGTIPCTICFLGDNSYSGAIKLVKVIVKKQNAKLTTAKKTYAAKTKTKKLIAKFLTAKGKAIAGKKISFKVNGKTYTAKTNSKRIATVIVKITKKGKYTFYAKFAGDNTYNAISKKSHLIIK